VRPGRRRAGLTAGLGLLAFAKLLGFSALGPARAHLQRRPLGRPVSLLGLGGLGVCLGALAPWEVHVLGSGLSAALGFDPSGAAITHPLTLGPVFGGFSVLAPTWLALVLPACALLAAGYTRVRLRPTVRRAPVWVAGSDAPLAGVQYRPSAYSNPMRVVLRGLLGFRRRITDDGELQSVVVLATDRFVYRPASRLALAASAVARRTQSGSLSTYLLYMLATLLLVLALVPALS
jgi:hydrogenase-4 component B